MSFLIRTVNLPLHLATEYANQCIVTGGTSAEVEGLAQNYFRGQYSTWVVEMPESTNVVSDGDHTYLDEQPSRFTLAEFQALVTQDQILRDQVDLAQRLYSEYREKNKKQHGFITN